MSDTELIRRILQSPRKVLVNKHPIHSMRATSHAASPNKQTRKHKKKLCKVKNTPKETSNQSKRSSSLGSPTMTMTPREKKEFHPTDNKLSSSNNPDVLCWLKEKNKLIRKQKRMERKKERQEKAAEQKVMEEKQKRLAESEDKFNQWMKHKKDESQRRQQIEKKVWKNAAKRGTSEWTEVSEGKTDHSPAKHRGTRFERQIKKRTTNSRKEIKIHKSVSSPKESVADNQRHSDEEARHRVVQNLEAERLQAEEKRQKKEAEKRRRRLFREAQHGSTNNSDSKSGTDEKSNDKTSSAAKPTPDTNNQPSACTTASIRKTMPSSNPFKGLTYDEWLKQKQADQRRQAKEAKTQEGGDPELDDFIPQLARRRIEQIKARATRVDSGLRRSQNSSDADKTDKSRTPNGVRPYTWTTTSSTPSDKHHKISRPSPPKNRKSTRTTKSSTAMPDVISFERPEPQGCERTEEITCQSPKPEQSKDANLNKEPILNKFKDLAVNENNQSRNEQLMSNMQASKEDTIFMTEPQTFKEVT
ncbi:trichohyalin-like [Acanthaster planci]|uniref:Trichohyalin-like n=1 Tax=Acanthaster planci TaxID=133434 RepID=A0A8B7ZSH1_ACAPL|nr:trichohyalin-like [Acanthaster planci]XP_022106407.1 trichohyalin-like [Acanthaster planci]